MYLPNQNCRFQMCSIVFVRATKFNVLISPTLCEQYTCIIHMHLYCYIGTKMIIGIIEDGDGMRVKDFISV